MVLRFLGITLQASGKVPLRDNPAMTMATDKHGNLDLGLTWHNSYLPKMEIDAQTYTVRADGQLLTCEPAVSLPMTQRYFLF